LLAAIEGSAQLSCPQSGAPRFLVDRNGAKQAASIVVTTIVIRIEFQAYGAEAGNGLERKVAP